MAKGFMYMTTNIDGQTRTIMGWRMGNSMNKQLCMDVLEAAIVENGVPERINSDQGLQYTSPTWTNYLTGKGIKISIDGKGLATDNIWIKRFWKTIKLSQAYLNPNDSGFELFEGVQTYIEYYQQKKQ